MLYFVKRGDYLAGIAARFGTTVQAILAKNVICNPNLIYIGQPLLIPDPGIDYPIAGGSPYYVIQYGDTLMCLAAKFFQSVASLAAANHLADPNRILVGSELLVGFNAPNPLELLNDWVEAARNTDCSFSSLEEHGVYYLGTFQWEALGEKALPYLVSLLRHSCQRVRYYAVISLGRIAHGAGTKRALEEAVKDADPEVSELARLALRRSAGVQRFGKRFHVTMAEHSLFSEPNGQSPSVSLPKGTAVVSLRWSIPSATNEEGPRGDLQLYDQVRVMNTGEEGFLPRVGFNEAWLL